MVTTDIAWWSLVSSISNYVNTIHHQLCRFNTRTQLRLKNRQIIILLNIQYVRFLSTTFTLLFSV